MNVVYGLTLVCEVNIVVMYVVSYTIIRWCVTGVRRVLLLMLELLKGLERMLMIRR